MFERLPPPDERRLARAPLQAATFQLDFAEERKLVPRDGIDWKSKLQARGHAIPRLVPVKQRTLNVSISRQTAEQSVSAERSGWQVFFEDNTSNASLYSTGINVELFNYAGYDGFKKNAMDAFDAAAELLAPQVQHKVYLSYSNALSDEQAESTEFWRGKVRPHFYGVLQDSALADGLLRSLSILSWASSDYAADMQVAIQPDQVYEGRIAFVFQTEISRRGVMPIVRDELAATIDSLHVIALKLFAAALEPAYLEELRTEVTKVHA